MTGSSEKSQVKDGENLLVHNCLSSTALGVIVTTTCWSRVWLSSGGWLQKDPFRAGYPRASEVGDRPSILLAVTVHAGGKGRQQGENILEFPHLSDIS